MTKIAVLFAAIVLATTASAQQPPPQPSARFGGNPAQGEAIAMRWCASCHTLPGGKSASDVAPSFRAIARDPRKDSDHLRGFLSHPHWPMPPLQLSRNEIENIIAYLQALRHEAE